MANFAKLLLAAAVCAVAASTVAGLMNGEVAKKGSRLMDQQELEENGLDVANFRRMNITGRFQDCHAIQEAGHTTNGIYTIRVGNKNKEVSCYFTRNGKAWTVIQQRVSNNVEFDQTLANYRDGFGDRSADYWIGLASIRQLVQQGNTQLQITLTSWAPQTRVANYGEFSVGSQSQGYALAVDDFAGSGGLVDDLSDSSGKPFFASDHPDPNNCALNQKGGWWFNRCAKTFLNGYHYSKGVYPPPPSGFYDGIYWGDWLGYDYSLQYVTMAVAHP